MQRPAVVLEKLVRELGRAAFDRMITPLKRSSCHSGLVLGFDTEYTAKGNDLLCYQLSDGDHAVLVEAKRLTVAGLVNTIVREYGAKRGDEVYLVAYFSIAELQFLPVKRESFSWREYGSGSFDCSFHSERHSITVHVFDLARFFDKQGLAKVAESFGLEKKEWKRETISRADLRRKGFAEYAKHDATITVQILNRLREEFSEWDVDPIREKTAASVASSVFRRGWVTTEITCESNRARLAGMRACWGGRAEALARGPFPKLHEYDLTSAYPNAAITLGELPCGDSWCEVRTLRQLEKCRGGFAQVRFEFPEDELYPSLPVILPTCQLYPQVGTEWVTFDEVRYALTLGCRIKLLEAWGYSRGTTVVRDYMEEILARRARASGAKKVALKLLANSLIGKFAQRVSDLDLEELRTKAEETGILIDDIGRMSREELRVLGLEAHARVGAVFMPEWNALITGRVRARIGQLARETHAVYVATDAVWCAKKLAKPPRDLTLKRKGPGIVARTRLGVIFDDEENPHVAHHSIWNRAAALKSLRALDSRRQTYELRRPVKLRESLRKGTDFGRWVTESRVADTYWDLKRRLHENGRDTEPWRTVADYRNAVASDKRIRAQDQRETEA